ncbi:MAG: bacteriohemerythrin [Bryobacteraceae bacterium]|jgi:hemerythrin
MGLYDWKPEYSIGCPPIDLQHKQIFRMAAELHEAMVSNAGSEVTKPMLEKVADYTRFHFSSEERMMLETGYPGYEEHHASHEKQIEKFAAFQDKAKTNGPMVMEAIRFLRDWPEPHIQRADMPVGLHWKRQTAMRSAPGQDDAKLAV